MSFDIELIVLNYTRFGENSLVLHCLSREYGRKGFIVRVGKKNPMARFAPLSVIEARVSENSKSELWTATGISTLQPLNGIRGNLYKNSIALFMSEVLFRVVRDEANEDGLFDWCLGSILTLDSLQSDYSNYHLRFLLDLSTALGFSPSVDSITPFSKSKLGIISKMISLPLEQSLLLPLTGEDRTEICENILKYIEFHTGSAVNIRSLAILHEVLND